MICTMHVRSREHELDHADSTAPTRQDELDHTYQVSYRSSALKDLDHHAGMDDDL